MATEFVDKNGVRYARPPRKPEIEARAKAFVAAREFLAEVGNATELAVKHGVNRSNIYNIAMILRFGTVDEIATVERFEEPILETWHKIKKRVPAEAIVKRQSKRGKEVTQVQQAEAAIFKRLKIGFDALSSMPNPQDVVLICKANRMRSAAVERHLLTLHTWLEDFSDAWTK